MFSVFALALVLAPAACHATSDRGADGGERRSTMPSAPAHLELVDAPAEGPVDAIVRDHAARAASARRRLVVYVGASWCEPCRRFHEAAARGDLDEAFGDVTLLVFDLDRDGERLQAAGYVSRYIPLLALPAPDGRASGRQIEGAVKGEAAVAFIVPRLRTLLGR